MADIIYSLNTAAIRSTFSKTFISREFKLRIHIFLDITLCCCKSISICFYRTSGPTPPMTWQKKCCENLKSHTIFIAEQKHGIERQFYVEEFVFQT